MRTIVVLAAPKLFSARQQNSAESFIFTWRRHVSDVWPCWRGQYLYKVPTWPFSLLKNFNTCPKSKNILTNGSFKDFSKLNKLTISEILATSVQIFIFHVLVGTFPEHLAFHSVNLTNIAYKSAWRIMSRDTGAGGDPPPAAAAPEPEVLIWNN